MPRITEADLKKQIKNKKNMKKILLTTLLLIIALTMFGQDTNKVYCDLKGVDNVSAKSVSVEIILDGEKLEMNELTNQNGERLRVTQMVEAMNFMSKLGWKLETTYAIFGNGRTVHHWIISKEIKNSNEVKEGLIIRK